MFRTIVAGFACSLACVFGADAAPLEAFGRLPNVQDVQVSPDGAYFAALAGQGDARQVQIRRMSDKRPVTFASAAGMKVRQLLWAGPRHLLVIPSQTKEFVDINVGKWEITQALDYDMNKKTWRSLLTTKKDTMPVIASEPMVRAIDGHELIFVIGIHFQRDINNAMGMVHGVPTLYRIDLDTGDTHAIADGDTKTQEWMVDGQGRLVARSDYEQASGRWSLLIDNNGRWSVAHAETAPIDTPSLQGLGPGGRSVLVKEGRDEDGGWHTASLTDGAWSAEVPEYKGKTLIYGPRTYAPIGGVTRTPTKILYTFFSAADQKVWDMIVAAFPDEQVSLASWSDDRSKIVVKVEGARDGDAYYAVDMSNGHAEWIADEYKDVGPADVSPRRFLTYKAGDGREIPAYLTLPAGRPEKNLPLVVLVHGGPAARDEPGFDWWSQALASRGYAVLQPEYRGSAGFGDAFEQAGYGEWGRKMQTDVSDGVTYLATQGVVDPKRVCIVGASYGGYAALAAATLQAGFYRCAVSVAGISDLKRMLQTEGDYWGDPKNVVSRYWDRYMGVKGSTDPKLREISPLTYASYVKAPVLLVHGQDDTVVPYEQSQVMVDALRRAGKPVEFVTLKGEDHWLSRGETRLQMLQATVKFLEANNPPDAPASSKVAVAQSH